MSGGFSFSPQGDVLTHIATDGRMQIWDAASGASLFDVPETALVNGFAWLGDGGRFLIQGMDGSFLIFDPSSRQWTFPLSYSLPLEMALSPSRQRMLAFASDGRATVFDLQREQRLVRLPWFPTDVSSAVISNEGDRIAYVVQSGAGGIRDASGEVLIEFASRTNGMWLSPNGELLATRAAENYNITLYNFRTGRLVREFPTNSASYNLEFSPDSSRLAMHTLQQQTILWDVQRDTEVATIDGDMIASFQASYLADGSRMFLTTKSRLLREWNGQSGELVQNLDWLGPIAVGGGSFSSDGNIVLVRREDGSVSVFNLVDRIESRIVGAGVAESAALSPTGAVAAILSRRDGILVLSLGDLQQSQQGQSVRACQQNRGRFVFEHRKTLDPSLSWHLLGRPANVCDWRGLGSWGGWSQWTEMWRRRLLWLFERFRFGHREASDAADT
jgi:WD40 repeat protein